MVKHVKEQLKMAKKTLETTLNRNRGPLASQKHQNQEKLHENVETNPNTTTTLSSAYLISYTIRHSRESIYPGEIFHGYTNFALSNQKLEGLARHFSQSHSLPEYSHIPVCLYFNGVILDPEITLSDCIQLVQNLSNENGEFMKPPPSKRPKIIISLDDDDGNNNNQGQIINPAVQENDQLILVALFPDQLYCPGKNPAKGEPFIEGFYESHKIINWRLPNGISHSSIIPSTWTIQNSLAYLSKCLSVKIFEIRISIYNFRLPFHLLICRVAQNHQYINVIAAENNLKLDWTQWKHLKASEIDLNVKKPNSQESLKIIGPPSDTMLQLSVRYLNQTKLYSIGINQRMEPLIKQSLIDFGLNQPNQTAFETMDGENDQDFVSESPPRSKKSKKKGRKRKTTPRKSQKTLKKKKSVPKKREYHLVSPDGENISPDDTPESLELEDEDLLDIE